MKQKQIDHSSTDGLFTSAADVGSAIPQRESTPMTTPSETPKGHWARRSDPHAHVLLAALVRALKPFIEAAAATMPASVTQMAVEVSTENSRRADVVCTTADGREERFVALGYGDVGDSLALAMGAIVVAGLNELPVEQRKNIAAYVEAGCVRLRLDPVFLIVTAHLELPGIEPVALFTLCGEPTN